MFILESSHGPDLGCGPPVDNCCFMFSDGLVGSEINMRHRTLTAEEEGKRASQCQREAEAARRLAEKERQQRTAECLTWRERHQELADKFRAQEDLKALRQNKSVRCRGARSLWYSFVIYLWPFDLGVLFLSTVSVRPTSKATSCAWRRATRGFESWKIKMAPREISRWDDAAGEIETLTLMSSLLIRSLSDVIRFKEADPVYISTPDSSPEDPETSTSRWALQKLQCPPEGTITKGSTRSFSHSIPLLLTATVSCLLLLDTSIIVQSVHSLFTLTFTPRFKSRENK